MAFLIKNVPQRTPASASRGGFAVIEQLIHVRRATATLPATTAQNIFQVFGGRVKVKALIGTVTTILQTQANNTKVSCTAKDSAGATVGTAVDVAANLDTTAIEVGGMIFVEGDGTALVKSTAGAVLIGTNSGEWIAPQGIISYTTAATSTGSIQWDIWYEPMDEGVYVSAI